MIYSANCIQGTTTTFFNALKALTLQGRNLTIYNSKGSISATPSTTEITLNYKLSKFLIICYKINLL